MKLVNGNTFWGENRAENPTYPILETNEECDTVIIGGGISGAFCAYYLTMAGINTILLEKNAIAEGSTVANNGILQYEVDNDLLGLKELLGIKKATTVFKLCADALKNVEEVVSTIEKPCGFKKRDSFYYTNSWFGERKIREEYLLRRYMGFDVSYLDKREAAEWFSFPVNVGIYSKGLAGEINPVAFVKELIAFAVQNGLRAYENTAAVKYDNQNEEIIVNTVTGKTIKAKRLIDAGGLDAARRYELPVNLKTTFGLVTAPVSGFEGWHSRCIIRDEGPTSKYYRTTEDKRIITGGNNSSLIDTNGNLFGVLPFASMQKHRLFHLKKNLEEMFVGIEDITVQYAYSAAIGSTKDGLPFIGANCEAPNLYYSLCCGNNGILFAEIAGRMLRDLILGETPPNIELFSMKR